MPKKALIILAQGFEEIEAVTCIDILRRGNIEVTAAGLGDIKIKASRGTNILADKKLDEVNADFDACILPGGMPGAKNLFESQKVTSILNKMNEEKKLIAAICAAPAVVLAPLGILNDKTATCFPGMEDGFNSSTICKKDNVVVDGNIITSRGAATALDFALKIVEYLEGKEICEKIKESILY